MVKGLPLQPRCWTPWFCNFRHLNIKATPAHHSIIQNEVDKLLAKGAIETSTGGIGFTQTYFSFLNVQVAYIPYSSIWHM